MSIMGLIPFFGAREAIVLRMRFGLDDQEPRTLKEIDESLGPTRVRDCQIETGTREKGDKSHY